MKTNKIKHKVNKMLVKNKWLITEHNKYNN